MPRLPTQGQILAEYNALVPRAVELGIRARTRTEWRGGRSAIQARLDDLRNSIAQFRTPSIGGTERFFGCEFEFHTPRNMIGDAGRREISRLLSEAGIDNRLTVWNDKAIVPWWKVTTDGTLGYTRGVELVSPKLSGERGFEQVRKALAVLLRAGCSAKSNKCGFHVHVGVQPETELNYVGEQLGFFKNVARLYRKYEPTIDSILSPSRRGAYAGNGFCNGMNFSSDALDRVSTLDELRRQHFAAEKYRKVNFSCYWRQGTVEFRHHQGTVDPQKAIKWIGFVLRLVEAASKRTRSDIEASSADLPGLMSLVAASEAEATYFQARQAHFSRGGTE